MTARFWSVFVVLCTALTALAAQDNGHVPAGKTPEVAALSPEDVSRALEPLFHASLDFYDTLQRTPTGVYRDAFFTDPGKSPSHTCSTAATGIGMMALCMDCELGRNPAAQQEALQTLRAINGKIEGFKIGREKAGYFQHFFFSLDGAGKSEYSTVDTAIMVIGALFCRNTFDDPQIKAEADELWKSIDWSAALADPSGTRLYMQFDDGKPRETSKTVLFNEYYLLACLIKESQIEKTGRSDIVAISDLPTWKNEGLDLLCARSRKPQCSFLVQFPFYMCHSCTTDPIYRDFVANQAKADQRECSKRVGVEEFWGCGAGGTPGDGYRANNYRNNPENIVSPHIIAGFMPVFPLARDHLLKLYRDPRHRVTTPVGELLPRFSVDKPNWRASRIESIDYSSMLFGLAAIHRQLGMNWFEERTRFTFNKDQ